MIRARQVAVVAIAVVTLTLLFACAGGERATQKSTKANKQDSSAHNNPPPDSAQHPKETPAQHITPRAEKQDLSTYQKLTPDSVRLSEEEQKLVQLVMEHRKEYGLPPIPVSKSLTYVAKMHLLDLDLNHPAKGKCNAHSWSDKGKWKSCCYTDDHARAECMWNKPRELAKYPGTGYEIARVGESPNVNYQLATAEASLAGWKSSEAHHDVMVNRKGWSDNTWRAMGVAIYKSNSVIWFGEVDDPRGAP